MRTKKNIPAFTTVDLLTGMAVMSIVMVLVFYLVSATFHQTLKYQELRMQITSYLILKADVKRQTQQAEYLENLPDGFKLVSDEKEISYHQLDHLLIRKSGHSTDTLSKNMTGMQKTVLVDEADLFEREILSDVHLTLNLNGVQLPCHLHKSYGISEFINQTLIYEF